MMARIQVKAHMAELSIFEHPIRIRVGLCSLDELFHRDGSQRLRKRSLL